MPQETPTTIKAPPISGPTGPQFTITPIKATEDAYSKQMGQKFADAEDSASTQAQRAQQALIDINTFTRVAPQIPLGTGPGAGILAWTSAAGQRAIKAQNRLALTLLSLQKFGRVTNKEMSIVQNSTLNVHMKPAAYTVLAKQLSAIAQRNVEYQKFLTAASLTGIRNIGIVNSIWNKYMQENPVLDINTGTVNEENISNWHKYLSPTYLRSELQAPVSVPKGFVYPGSPEAARK
jgi:hypothetical protein